MPASSAPELRYRLAPKEIRVGPGVAGGLPKIVERLGGRCLVVHDTGSERAAQAASEAMIGTGLDVQVHAFFGECTPSAIARLAGEAAGATVLAFGGGKALDTAKAAAEKQDVPCINVPTSAATCAAYTPLSILHEDDGAYVESRRLTQPVEALVLDLELLVGAPPRLLAAGMADAAARAFDTILAARIRVPSAMAAMSLAICREYLFQTLLPLGDQALADNGARIASDAVQRVIEACILGAGLAGETGARFFGRSFSHAVAYALSHVVDSDGVLHGEAAGLGILVHCLLDPEPPVAFEAMRQRFATWGLPISFAEVGIEDLAGVCGQALAERTYEYLDRERAIPFAVDADAIHDAMMLSDRAASAD